MRTKTVAFFFGLFSLFLFSCQTGFEKTESGLEYKIFRHGSGEIAKSGSTVKLHYSQVLRDTVTMTTQGKMPYYKALIPGTIFAYDPFEVLTKGVRAGDSIVVIQRLDSLLKKGRLSKLPPHLKPEDALEVRIKVLKVFPFDLLRPNYTDSLVYADKAAERALLDSLHTILGPKRIEAYLEKQRIQATRNGHGTWVELIEPGNGMVADSGKWVQAKFTIQTLQGRVIDSNIDTTFRKDGPLKFQVGSGY
jgi:FKBP-type peptidyl-prolyl cis-trans isomerase FkpA